MAAITEDLMNELRKTTDIKSFFDKHEKEFIKETPSSFLNYMIVGKNITPSEAAKASGVGEYVYKILNGTRTPSRNILIAVAFGIKLDLEETQLLLRISKFAILDSRDKRDSIIIYGLVNGLTIFETDEILDKNDMVTINKLN